MKSLYNPFDPCVQPSTNPMYWVNMDEKKAHEVYLLLCWIPYPTRMGPFFRQTFLSVHLGYLAVSTF